MSGKPNAYNHAVNQGFQDIRALERAVELLVKHDHNPMLAKAILRQAISRQAEILVKMATKEDDRTTMAQASEFLLK